MAHALGKIGAQVSTTFSPQPGARKRPGSTGRVCWVALRTGRQDGGGRGRADALDDVKRNDQEEVEELV
ncbi:uncharacterized protein PG998_010206 [Apiospora kogelbergensis]|uniref:uncharacterized protein n=1 Tax=Apiospora kogelbergensis TaxID=1337665 RepID=UPI00312EB0AD